MKTFFISLIMLSISLSILSAEAYPPEGWTSDVLEAMKESEETGKDILLNFTGSDWCSWCHRLWDEVLGTEEFKEYAEDNLVLLFLDFPNGIDLPEETVKNNELMASVFGVQGFPTIWLMDSSQLPLMKTGYQAGGSDAYIQHLENDRPDLDEATKDQYRDIIRQAVTENIGSW